jgi:lysophospholipase L1-like esterase
MLSAFDRLVIARGIAPPPPFPPLMTPHTRVEYQTTEFHWTIETNDLGLRDRTFEWSRRGGSRVLAIGDSFTLGWGVGVGDSWVKVLERNLRRAGQAVEVINAGKGGAGPAWYAEAAEAMVPVLRPDLVIVAVLQGDDLAQAIPRPSPGPPAPGPQGAPAPAWARTLEDVVGLISPNLQRRWRGDGTPLARSSSIRVAWEGDVAGRIARMSATERAWLDRLDPTVQRLFRGGNLNPGLVTLALVEPDHFRMTLHPEEDKTRARMEAMVAQLERIRVVAQRHRARVLVAVVPYGAFVSRRQWEAIRKIGFQVEPGFLTSTAPDDLVREAAERAGLAPVSLTPAFRDVANDRPLYFEWDGHFNEAGHDLYADRLTPLVAPYVAR